MTTRTLARKMTLRHAEVEGAADDAAKAEEADRLHAARYGQTGSTFAGQGLREGDESREPQGALQSDDTKGARRLRRQR